MSMWQRNPELSTVAKRLPRIPSFQPFPSCKQATLQLALIMAVPLIREKDSIEIH